MNGIDNKKIAKKGNSCENKRNTSFRIPFNFTLIFKVEVE